MQQKAQAHEYDNTLKALFGDEAAEIIPQVLPEAELVGEYNIEIDRSKLKADLVYNTKYQGQLTILNMELQTNREANMEVRLLQYHIGLHAKHAVPVISMVIYPFEVNIQQPPYEEKIGDELFLTFHYKVLCLWKLAAEPFVRDHVVCMYTLLPAMQGASATLLKQALKEMAQRYTRPQLGHHLIRFHRIMQRAKTMSEQDKREVEEELHMQYQYDEFIDDNPLVQEHIARGIAKGIEKYFSEIQAKGEIKDIAKREAIQKTEGQVLGLQQSILSIVNVRFPALAEQAQQQVTKISSIEDLDRLIKQLAVASDEATALWLFHS